DELFESFRTKALDRLGKALASGDYFGWLVSPRNAPQKIIAGAGVIIREVPPFPIRHKNGEITIAEGRQGLIVNVFTEPEYRPRSRSRRPMRCGSGDWQSQAQEKVNEIPVGWKRAFGDRAREQRNREANCDHCFRQRER